MATKRSRRLFIVLPMVMILLGAALGWKLMNTAPAWARHHFTTSAQAQEADQHLLDAVNWTADAQRRHLLADAAVAQLPPLPPLEITFSQDDLDAFFDQCSAQFGWFDDAQRESPGDADSPAGLVLEGNRLILTLAAYGAGSVLSVQFEPRLVDGKLLVPMVRVQKGMLPVPSTLWRAWRDGMVAQLRRQLPADSQRAAIAADGSANAALMQAETLRLLIDALDNRPAEPIVFFPYLQDFHRHFLPVRLTRLEIANHALSLAARPLDRGETSALLARIHAADD